MNTIAETGMTIEPAAPVLALDWGEKQVGVAISDALSISIKRIEALRRTNWKQMLRTVEELIQRFDAKTLVIGFPLQLNGSTGEAALIARSTALKFAQSLRVPVYLQDERLSSVEAEETLRAAGHTRETLSDLIDSEAAAIILRDFLVTNQKRRLVLPPDQAS
jgi:putative Holliday junction resolvase